MTGPVRVVAEGLAVPSTAVDAVDVCWHEPPDPSGVAVLVTHGAGGDLTDHVLVELADELAAGGHLVGRVNLPYRQRRASGPPPRAEASVADLASVLAAAAETRPGHRWVLGGKSYGGRVATLVAAEAPTHDHDLDHDDAQPIGLLCVSYPLHPPGRPDRLRVAHFPDVAVPVLVVQGGDDPFGGPDELRPHLPTLGGPARLLEVPHADHGLHVARTRSADGRTHRSAHVLAHRGGELRAWLSALTG
ncbi:alpha/beta family hydrolase [Salsipaludibacter albus]|uniref:alpha/beta hydrolase family protein n=1 Tax=Salsipaludibacter albus TaxID=2849650 RepID=UPI001EE3BB59|nr:alpha/beta family hydrolase [Salsipaludibacter albus]MBY5162813.1 alpha/beta hydrolase [Salsipaludibacter albus]